MNHVPPGQGTQTQGTDVERARSKGAEALSPRTGGAFHTLYTAPAADDLRSALKDSSLTRGRQPAAASADAPARIAPGTEALPADSPAARDKVTDGLPGVRR